MRCVPLTRHPPRLLVSRARSSTPSAGPGRGAVAHPALAHSRPPCRMCVARPAVVRVGGGGAPSARLPHHRLEGASGSGGRCGDAPTRHVGWRIYFALHECLRPSLSSAVYIHIQYFGEAGYAAEKVRRRLGGEPGRNRDRVCVARTVRLVSEKSAAPLPTSRRVSAASHIETV